MDLKHRQNKAAAHIRNIFEQKSMPRNQVAALSGLSNPYIQHLENGQINNVNRKKIIALAIALGLDLDEIDEMLTIFDRAKLQEADIPFFIDPGMKRKITSAMLPLHGGFTYELILSIGEKIIGKSIIVNDRPTANLQPEGFRTFLDRDFINSHPLHFQLLESIGQDRYNNFIETLNKYSVDHYICQPCLEEYMHDCRDKEEKEWRRKHLSLLIKILSNFKSFNLYLMDYCPKFNFTLKIPATEDVKNEQLFFQGRSIHSKSIERDHRLFGFATESPAVVQNFKEALLGIKKSVINDLLDKKKLINYLKSLLC